MASKSFSAQVSGWVAKSERLTKAVIKQSAQTVSDEMTRPRFAGGNLPVKTGYLRNSATANIGAMPSGPTSAAEGSAKGGEAQITTEIIRWDLMKPLYVGFTARYARVQEINFGYMRLAAQRWQAIVRQTANDAKRAAR